MSDRSAEILRAVREASHVREDFPLVSGTTSFDIIGTVVSLGLPLLFRPLKGLLGAAVTIGDDRGMLITTNRDRHVQRFTLAHELGHLILGHQTKFDTDIQYMGRFSDGARPIEEVAADTFASELLMPKALAQANASRHGWSIAALQHPENIYQLGLRLGLSFKATCWGLVEHKVLGIPDAWRLQDTVVKKVKFGIEGSQHHEDPWGDVWRLSAGDTNTKIEAGPTDTFVVELHDNSSAGFLWELADVGRAEVLDEVATDRPGYGGAAQRLVTLRFREPGRHLLRFVHRRPWSSMTSGQIEINVMNLGKELPGLPRCVREEILAS